MRGLGCFWGIELVKNRETREMLVPFNASGEAGAPSADQRSAELGLYRWSLERAHGRAAATLTPEEAEEGVAILDDVLSIADDYVV